MLGSIHGLVGVLHQHIGAGAIVGIQGDADAGRNVGNFLLQVERRAHLFENFLGNTHHVARIVQLAQDDGEFIPAQPGHDIAAADAGGKTDCHFLEQQIALVMAQRVVDLLEIVEVDEHQRHGQQGTVRFFHFQPQMLMEHAPVRQAGEGVEIGLPPDQFFGCLLLGDVGEQTHVPERFAVLVVDGIETQRHQVVLAVLVLMPQFAFPLAAGGDRLLHPMEKVLVLATGSQFIGVVADHFLFRVAAQAGKSIVDGQDAPFRIGHHHPFAAVAVHQSAQLFAFRQFRLRFAAGNVQLAVAQFPFFQPGVGTQRKMAAGQH